MREEVYECEHGRLKRVCPLCELQDELGLALTEVGRLEAQLAALRAENERLRNELYKSNLTIVNNVIPPCEGDDPEDIGVIIWRKWPGEKPVNDDPIERIALSDEGKIYLTKTPPSQWCKGNSFRWAEIPRPNRGERWATMKKSQSSSRRRGKG